jgi:hypothetical protein
MRWLIACLIGILATSDLLDWDLSLAPGLSVKNAGLYMIAMTLLFRAVLSGRKILYLPGVQVLLMALIGYGTLSLLTAAFVIEYPRYELYDSVIALKSKLVDPAFFMLAVFYGLRDFRDTRWLLRVLLAALAIVNLLTLTDLVGATNIGMKMGTQGGEAGRVFGGFGHANDTAALIVCLLPAMLATAISVRGLTRAMWWAGVLVTLIVLIMTVSRGAYVGLAVGTLIGAFLCRRYLPLSKLVAGGLVATVIVGLAVLVVVISDPQMGAILSERLVGTSRSVDAFEASSGRTNIWWAAFSHMLASPTTLITGFGWNAYSVMPLHFAPHNHYLGLYFELGLVGLLLFVLIQRYVIVTALRSLPAAEGEMRNQFIAFVFGILCLSVSIFFADLFKPWPYIWMYVGMIMRGVVDLRQTREAEAALPATPPPEASPGRFGRPISAATRLART